MIASGKTEGVFQLESAGMKSFMKELKPSSLEDIIAGISLYRPGPMDFIPKYIKGKQNQASIVYDCPELEEILAPTYGCIVYQEQVMQIVMKLSLIHIQMCIRDRDTTVIEDTTGNAYYVVYFIDRYLDHAKTVDVRHILIRSSAETTDEMTDEEKATAEENAKAEAKQKAEDIYAEWKNGDATEDSFAALAEANSEDVYKRQLLNS